MNKLKKIIIYTFVFFFTIFTLIQAIPNAVADTQNGFIIASAGKDGKIGTNDDLIATDTQVTVKKTTDTTQFNLTNAIPSNVQAGQIVLSVDKTSIPSDGKTKATIEAVCYDKYGNLLPDNTVINFSTTLGILNATSAKTINGIATVTILSTNNGTATVTANNGSISSSVMLTFTQPFTFNITSDILKAFDGDLNTYITIPAYSQNLMITWKGDLSNKKLAITLTGYYYPGGTPYPINVYMYDATGNQIEFVNADTNKTVNYIQVSGIKYIGLGYTYSPETVHVIVPPNAAKIGIGAYYYGGRVYEISVVD